ncbi:MAG: MetQ/NlpA family ABC transporter substrate-binding protein, partial [Anaerolineales bacterium]
MKKNSFLILSILLTIVSGACSGSQQPQSLRIAVLPVLDVLPLYVAQAQGYFTDAGLEVELVPVNSAPERDQLMQAGQIDGMLNELESTILYNRDETRVQVIRFARIATSEYPLFRILSAPNSGIENVMGLREVPVAISDGTIIEYTTDRLLQNAGLTPDEIEKVSVPKIPDRMALLLSGEVKAANLPDPVASLALLNGCTLVIDDTV